jgi:hypothetical protein
LRQSAIIAVVLLCDEDKAEHVKAAVSRIMVEVTHSIFPGAPMRADCNIIDNWAQK